MRPTWRVAGALALGLVLEWYATTSEVSWLFLLAAWILALAVAAYVYAVWNRAGLRLHLIMRAPRAAVGSPAEELPDQVMRTAPAAGPLFEGDGVELEVGLDTSGSARGPAWLRGHVGHEEIAMGTGLVPRAGWSRLKIVRELRRGPVGATGWEVTASDPLGFFKSRRASPDAEVTLVLPRFTSLRAHHQVRELEASVAAPRAGSGSELFGVREFRPGDPLRRIHWRSTARRGELVVREFERPGVHTLGIFCDPSPANGEVADQVARIAASEAWDCIQDGGRVMVWAPGLEPTGTREARDLWAVLEWLARYPAQPAADDAPPAVSEAVAVVGGADGAVLEALEETRRRGGRVRAWAVGEAELDLEAPVTRVGTSWPL